jgi:hypothetical protein
MRNKNQGYVHLQRSLVAVCVLLLAAQPCSVLAQAFDGRYAPLTGGDRSAWSGAGTPLYPMANPADVPSDQRSALFKGQSGRVDYSANSEAAHLVVEVDRNGVPADGQTPVGVTLRVLGKDGKALANAVVATIEVSGGRILLPGAKTDELGPDARSADRSTPGVQLEVKNGLAHFRLLAPITPQDVQLRVTVGEQEASGMVSFVPDMRKMVAAGLVEGIINFSNGANLLAPAHTNDGFDAEIQHFSTVFGNGQASAGARSAFFLKGVIKGEYLLTASYDSDKDVQSRLQSAVRPDDFYPVYGDSSIKGEEAKSSTALYVRIDKDKCYLMYGDFVTGDGFSQRSGGGAVAGLQQRSLGAYNRSATGIRWHYEKDKVTGNVFAINDTLRQVIDEFASQGSGPYALSNNGAVQDREKVEVVVRDRNMPARILSTTQLMPLADYTFEPFSGRIVLNQFLPAFDPNLNPVSLRVTYEVDQGGEAFWVLGADGQLRINEHFEIGGSAVQDQNPLAGNRLTSANASWRIAPGTMLVAEVAQTISEVNTNPVNQNTLPGLVNMNGDVAGQAWRVELAHETETTKGHLFIGQSDPTFNNLAAPLTGGKAEAMAQGSVKLSSTTDIYAQAQHNEDRNPGMASSDEAQVGIKVKLTDRLLLDAGVRALSQSSGIVAATAAAPFSSTAGLTGSIASGAAGSATGYGNQVIDTVSGLPVIQNGTLPVLPTLNQASGMQTETARVGLGFKATDRLTLGGEVESSVSGDPLQRYSLGGDYLLAERTRMYARLEQLSGVSSPTNPTAPNADSEALVFGIDTSYWHDAQLFSEYRMRDSLSGSDTELASGVRNSWLLSPGLRANTAYERTEVLSGAAPVTQAVSGGLDYTADPLWRGSTKLEYRVSGDVPGSVTDQGFNTTMWQVMAARKLSRDWTFLSRNYMLLTQHDATGSVFQDRVQVGAAYRENDRNRVNALAKYEYKTEQDNSNAAVGPLASTAHIVSVLADYHPSRPWWTTGRIAAKWQQDQLEGGINDSFQAQLLSGRITYDVTEDWDVGVMAAVQLGQHASQQTATGVEVGYLLQQNLWLSVGYNYAGFSANSDLAGYEYTREGIYLRLRFKFDQDLFAGSNQNINRTLDR